MPEPSLADSSSPLSQEAFTRLALEVLDGVASEEDRLRLAAELRGPLAAKRREYYVSLARLTGELKEAVSSSPALSPLVESCELGPDLEDHLQEVDSNLQGRLTSPEGIGAHLPGRRPTLRIRSARRLSPDLRNAQALLAATILFGLGLVFVFSGSGHRLTGRDLSLGSRSPRQSREAMAVSREESGESRKTNLPGEPSLRAPQEPLLPGTGAGESRMPPGSPLPEREPREGSSQSSSLGSDPFRKAADPGGGGKSSRDPGVALGGSTPAPERPSRPPGSEVEQLGPRAVARIERVEAEVYLLTGASERRRPEVGDAVPVLAGLQTGGNQSRACLTFADGTSVALGAESQIGPISEADGVLASKGKRVTILRGTLEATVAKQPPEEPMIFLTPQGQIRVLGTSLRVRVDPGPGGQTRLEVEEGLVRFVRTSDGRSAQVGTGMTLSVGNSGGSLVVVPRTNDDILLHARDATLVGNDWGVVRDEKATTGWALDSPRGTMRQDSVARSTSFVSFTFPVDEGKDYFVWVRGACLWRSNQRLQHDAVALVTLDGRFSKTNLARPGDATCYLFNGWGEGQGEREATYFWLGGENASDSVTLRFPRSGLATVTLHSMEGPMRIDALWISTSQKTLPEANVPGPPGTRK